MKVFLSLLIVLIYWFSDAYQSAQYLNIPYLQAFILDYEQANYFTKFLTSVFLFCIPFIHIEKKAPQKEELNCDPEQFSAIYKISDVILSPIPLHKQLNSIVSIIEDKLKVKTVFIGQFGKDSILILNTNDSLANFGVKDKYLPHQDNIKQHTLDNLLSICFLEKRDFIDDVIQINGNSFRIVLKLFKDGNTILGVIVTILDESNEIDYTNFLSKVSEQIGFTVNLTNKKDNAIKSQNAYNAKFLSIDPQLNIPSSSKLQNMISHEVKRVQRYGTKLSLMLIEIDHMENFSNIFLEKEIVALKKDIISVIKKEVRETDLFGKWNDDNFAIIVPDVDYRGTKNFADKITKKLTEHRFTKVGKITCSYGITSFFPKDTIVEFRKRAENALNVAIERGGNTIEVKILV